MLSPTEWVMLLPKAEVFLKPSCLNSIHLGTSELKQYEIAQSLHQKKKLKHCHPNSVGEDARFACGHVIFPVLISKSVCTLWHLRESIAQWDWLISFILKNAIFLIWRNLLLMDLRRRWTLFRSGETPWRKKKFPSHFLGKEVNFHFSKCQFVAP